MNERAGRDFAGELTRFAAAVSEPQVMAIAERVAAPLQVAVSGRGGVGRRTVAEVLGCAGMVITEGPGADITVYVVAEVAKPEDVTAVSALAQPALVVLNKADLTGRAATAEVSAHLGVSVEPLAGLLALALLGDRLDEPLWAALRVLAVEPADLSSAECFLAGRHPVPSQVRARLCDTLDLPGIRHAVAVIRDGGSVDALRVLLRRLSGVDAVLRRLAAIGAVVHYRRLLDAVTRLEALAVGGDWIGDRIGAFLSADSTVLARMAAAVAVVEADGVAVAVAGDSLAHLRRAAHWQRYSRGPVTALHRHCGIDIARGALRLWSPVGGPQ